MKGGDRYTETAEEDGKGRDERGKETKRGRSFSSKRCESWAEEFYSSSRREY